MNSFNQLPGEGAEEEVVEENSNGGTHGIRAGHQCLIHAYQKQKLGQKQGYRELSMDGVQVFCIQPGVGKEG